jgi:chemotaxis protein MotA
MNLSSVLGIPVGFGALLIAYIFERGKLSSLVLPSPFIIILGGTFGALLLSFDMRDVFAIPKLIGQAMKSRGSKLKSLAQLFLNFAEKARRDGLLALEEDLSSLDREIDPILKKGLRYVIDGTDPEVISAMLETEISIWEKERKREARIFEAAGGFSPTMGIIGTVLGLVIVLSNLAEPERLGESIAVAFIATLYGISFANLVWLPLANKLKLQMEQQKHEKEMILEGVLAIQQGESPKLVGDKLAAFLEEKDRAGIESFEED